MPSDTFHLPDTGVGCSCSESSPGVGRRRNLAALTDSWLRQVFAEAVTPRGWRPARSPSSRSEGTGAASCPLAATSTCCSCTRTATTCRASPPWPTRSGTRCGTAACGSTTACGRSTRPGGWRARTSPCCWACSTHGRSPGSRASSAGCARASSPTGGARPGAGCPSCARPGRSGAHGPATCATTSSPTSRRAAAACATSSRCGRWRLRGSPTVRTGTWTRQCASLPTYAMPCTSSPVARPTSCSCRSRTRWPRSSVSATPTPCSARWAGQRRP